MAIAFDANLGTTTDAATHTTTAAAASGSRVFFFVWWFGDGQTITGASGGGLTWVVDHQAEYTASGDQHIAILSADAPSGLASSTVLDPTFSAGPDFGPGLAAASFTGLATGASGYIDATSTPKEDFEEAWTTNNLVTTMADTLLIAMSLGVDATAHAAATDYTELNTDWIAEGAQRVVAIYRIVSSASTYNPGGTWTAAGGVSSQHNLAVAYESSGGVSPTIVSPSGIALASALSPLILLRPFVSVTVR
jgi:hypothetical protein